MRCTFCGRETEFLSPRKVTFWRQAQTIPILALRSVELEGLEGIIVVFDLGQVGRGFKAARCGPRVTRICFFATWSGTLVPYVH